MSLCVKLKQFQMARSKGDKIARVEFRGVSHCTQVLDDTGELLVVDKRFEWPVARPVENEELLKVELVSLGRFQQILPSSAGRVIGSYILVLQSLIRESPRLHVSDTLLDNNNKPLPITVEFEVSYTIPDMASSSSAMTYGTGASADDESQMLMDIERNIASLERSLAANAAAIDEEAATRARGRKRSSTLRSLMRLGGKSRRATSASSRDSTDGEGDGDDDRRALIRAGTPETATVSRAVSQTSISSDNDSIQSGMMIEGAVSKKAAKLREQVSTVQSILKAQDFQVCVTIIEARQLAGLNMDPVVCVQVGDTKKYTSVKESTNCPYYNEYFVFDFHMPAVMLFDKIITLSVLHSRRLLFAGMLVGSFKIDVKTVHDAADHQFYHKWALLTDPEDVGSGPKGYLKCDISVRGKGDPVKVPTRLSERDEDDIEANLLLPDGVAMERQRARFLVRIYRADGLPKMNSSLVANVKKAFTGERDDLVNPYVQVSFAGLTGRTSVKKACYTPVWNEQLIFTDMFPPLCQRVKIQLRDASAVAPANSVIGTHYIDLKMISNDGDKGFLPTLGPAFIHLYGSTRDYSLLDEHSSLNAGLGEGAAYRARLLVALRTEITDSLDMAGTVVDVEPTPPVAEASYGKPEQFFLFATILEANMIDRVRSGDKPISFELSIGNAGNSLDGHNESSSSGASAVSSGGHEGEGEELEVVSEESSWQSTTPPMKAMSHDKSHYFLPYWDNKPCLHVRSVWPDHRRRMYNSNIIAKIADKLEDGLNDAQSSLADGDDTPAAVAILKSALDELASGCAKYTSISRSASTGPNAGKTKLDKERMKLCLREIEHMGSNARNLKALVTPSSFRERFKAAQSFLTKLKFLTEDPQHSLPDVFIWLVSGGKRIAYQRVTSREIIYSIVDEERGKECARVQTLLLKLPGKRGSGQGSWVVPARLRIYMWLGFVKHKKHFCSGLPKGYEVSHEIRNADRPHALPPSVIHYVEKHIFQLRAHIYQARSLIGSDASGLSDPFARVVIGERSRTTQVIDETLSPTWDELLVLDDILVYGTKDDIQSDPPTVVVEVFDRDKVGKSEFIGRAAAKPHVKLCDEPYTKPRFPPSLEWYDISRGSDDAGELLAAFELLEVSPHETSTLPNLPQPKETIVIPGEHDDTGPILPVPRGIRPTLSKYRVEVLFWGLRDLKRVHLMTVDRPRVDIECGGQVLHSSVIQNARRNPNFSTQVKYMDVELPEQELYRPPLTIRAVDCRSFGRYTLVGTHTIGSIHRYMYSTPANSSILKQDANGRPSILTGSTPNAVLSPTGALLSVTDTEKGQERSPLLPRVSLSYGTNHSEKKSESRKKRKHEIDNSVQDDDETKDWWTKYYASEEAMNEEMQTETTKQQQQQNGGITPTSGIDGHSDHHEKKRLGIRGATSAARFVSKLSPKSVRRKRKPNTALCKIYPNELESLMEFNEFKEWLLTFELYRGKKTGDDSDDESRVVGSFKGAIKVYKWPPPSNPEIDLQHGFFQNVPSNEPIHVLVRVYVIKATDLHPMDINGKADPYVVLQLGSKRISDKEHYVSKQLNPVFGKCFEFEATFPQDSLLTVQIWDWDLVGADDLIGETRIDLENRFYSRHRATCGIASLYETTGYNQWRDPMKPTQILAKLCKDAKLDPPLYGYNQVRVGKHTFFVECGEDGETIIGDNGVIIPKQYMQTGQHNDEFVALTALKRWHELPRIGTILVPEHVESRALFNTARPGVEQGRLKMWVDMFPMDMPLPGAPLDVSPRRPTPYELRIVVWNTDDVVLEDDAFFTGEKMSDIYVKGWLKGPEDCQCTDIHYRSLTGEGNFNWRFVYPFEYMAAEEKIVISRKQSLFSWDESEVKIPARLELQVWDADHFSADDFLGAMTLDLNRFPRGAKSSKLCTLDMLKTDGSVPTVNIFKQRRVRGWWPFHVKKDNEHIELTGKLEAEIHLLTKEEAEKSPAGFGRGEPDALDKPNRPDASFMWFLNPLKSIRYIIWHNYKWKILKLFIVLIIATLIMLFFYSLPGYTVKKMIGA